MAFWKIASLKIASRIPDTSGLLVLNRFSKGIKSINPWKKFALCPGLSRRDGFATNSGQPFIFYIYYAFYA
jgi:hypothetical protein